MTQNITHVQNYEDIIISLMINMKQALPGKLAKLIANKISLVLDEQTYAKLYAYVVHIIIYQLFLKIEIWFTSDHQ